MKKDFNYIRKAMKSPVDAPVSNGVAGVQFTTSNITMSNVIDTEELKIERIKSRLEGSSMKDLMGMLKVCEQAIEQFKDIEDNPHIILGSPMMTIPVYELFDIIREELKKKRKNIFLIGGKVCEMVGSGRACGKPIYLKYLFQ
jgi:hypothetical protein